MRVAAELGGAPVRTEPSLTDEAAVDRLFADARDVARIGGRVRRRSRRVAAQNQHGAGAALERRQTTRSAGADGELVRRTAVCARCDGSRLARARGSTAGLVGEAGQPTSRPRRRRGDSGSLFSLKNEVVRVAPAARVNAVAPGWTESPMTRGLVDPRCRPTRLHARVAATEGGRPEDVAAQVVVLASDVLSGHVTEPVVTVAGGTEGRTIHELSSSRRVSSSSLELRARGAFRRSA